MAEGSTSSLVSSARFAGAGGAAKTDPQQGLASGRIYGKSPKSGNNDGSKIVEHSVLPSGKDAGMMEDKGKKKTGIGKLLKPDWL